MPEDEDIEELKKLYMDEVGPDSAGNPQKNTRRKYNYGSSNKRILLTIIISLLTFFLGFFLGNGPYFLDREEKPLILKSNRSGPDKSDQRDAGFIKFEPGLADGLGKPPSAYYVTVTPLDLTPSSQNNENKPTQKIIELKNKRQPGNAIKSVKEDILPDSKKIDLASDKKRYSIQVGSFQDKSEADLLVDELNNNGYPAYLIKSTIPQKGVWYRVRVGYFQTRKEAEKFSSEIKKREKLPNYVTFTAK